MTNHPLWTQLGTRSRRALSRRNKRFGHPYTYRPRGTLLLRLARENNTTIETIYQQLMELRAELLRSNY